MRLAIVIPWFGRDLRGGAEQHAWQLAARLTARGHAIDVLTTCCRSHQDDWATNHLPEGVVRETEGFSIRRFPVDPRDTAQFDRVCSALLKLDAAQLLPGVSPVRPQDSQIFTTELIRSRALLQYLDENKENYHRLIFLPYFYGPTVAGVEITKERAVLLPCLHDEAYAYLPDVAETFYRAGSILFISEGEQELAFRLFGPAIILKSTLAGAGVEIEAPVAFTTDAPGRYPKKFVLYLGRKDPGKNVPLLVAAFRRFRAVRPNSELQLVLAGYGHVELYESDYIIDAGLVTDSEKRELLITCVALAQPSQNESFSRVMMEGWLNCKPVAVHARCVATALAVERANGGWKAADERGWAQLFVDLDRLSSAELAELGRNGNAYARAMADWEDVIDHYERALSKPTVTPSIASRSRQRVSINQFLPNLTYGDAISNHALWIRQQLRDRGLKSEIYVRFIDDRVASECGKFSPKALRFSDAIIYHHSIGSEITPSVVAFDGPKCLIYHNITPAEFFEPYRPGFATILRQGRSELHTLANNFDVALGDSTFNTDELAECGFADAKVLPICVDPRKWDIAPDPELMRTLQDGRTNVLFVGRIAPNKRQEDLVLTFAHLRALNRETRLFLIGFFEGDDPYATYLRELIETLGLNDCVFLPGSVPDSQLAAYYRTASLFWSMSEHEGFCVPLIEAMWFDLPVLAYRSSAVPETVGHAAMLFPEKNSLTKMAEEAHALLTDETLRNRVLSAQRRERERFLPESVAPVLSRAIDRLLGSYSRDKRPRLEPVPLS